MDFSIKLYPFFLTGFGNKDELSLTKEFWVDWIAKRNKRNIIHNL
jgi:hypothetical protein